MKVLLRRMARVLAAIGVLVLLLGALAAGALWLTIPGSGQTASVPGLAGAADITRGRLQ